MFIQLGDYFFSVTEILAIKKIGSGANVDTKDGETYKVADVTDEQWRKLSCCSSPYFCTLNEEEK